MIYAQVTEPHAQSPEPQSRVETTRVNPPPGPGPAPGSGPHVASPAEVESLAASAPAAAQQFQIALAPGVASEDRLQVKTIRWAARANQLAVPADSKPSMGTGKIRCRGIPTGWRST